MGGMKTYNSNSLTGLTPHTLLTKSKMVHPEDVMPRYWRTYAGYDVKYSTVSSKNRPKSAAFVFSNMEPIAVEKCPGMGRQHRLLIIYLDDDDDPFPHVFIFLPLKEADFVSI